MRKHLFLATVLLILFAGCGKSNNNSGTPINATLKKYFSYKPGTYWIYQDSLSGNIDSFVVVSVDSGLTNYSAGGNNFYINDEIVTFNNGIYDDTLNCRWTLAINGISYFLGYPPVIPTPPNLINTLSYSFIYPFQGYSYTTYSYRGNTYNNIAEFFIPNNSVVGNPNDIFLISTDAGIVKMSINHANTNYIWQLQRYKIIY